MFDVIWADPDRELIGEHRAKKEKRRREKDKQQKRSSLSTTRSSFSSSDSPFSFLRSHGLKRINTSDANSRAKSSASSRLASPSISSTRSPLSPTFDTRTRPNSEFSTTCSSADPSPTAAHSNNSIAQKLRTSGDDVSPGLSRHGKPSRKASNHSSLIASSSDSIFSKYAESEVRTSISVGETSVCDGRALPTSSTQTSPKRIITPSNKQSRNSHEPILTLTPPREMASPTRASCKIKPNSAPVMVPGPLTPVRSGHVFKPNDSDAWQTPDQWDGSLKTKNPSYTEKAEGPSPLVISPSQPIPEMLLDIEIWKQKIQQMSAQTPEEIISTIHAFSIPEVEGVLEELERKRLMLWALNHLDPIPSNDTSKISATRISMEDATICLALHESPVTTSYFAALHPSKHFIHLASSPLSANFATNIYPVPIPQTHPFPYPLTNARFDTAFSLSLPSLHPAHEISALLNNISKSLNPGGSLNLIIIDPMPIAATTGPHLRHWLITNLLSNLAQASRCRNPSRWVYKWFHDANLRGAGSLLNSVKAFAVYERSSHISKSDNVIKAEIRSHVGRWLWKEVWGEFVTGGKWWWDDPLCVQECKELGTIWEYIRVEGVRGAEPVTEVLPVAEALPMVPSAGVEEAKEG